MRKGLGEEDTIEAIPVKGSVFKDRDRHIPFATVPRPEEHV
jgi:hypothetical protein